MHAKKGIEVATAIGVRRISHEGSRVETGPVSFGEDWPGLFIRGDNCIFYSEQLGWALEKLNALNDGTVEHQIMFDAVLGLANLLSEPLVEPK